MSKAVCENLYIKILYIRNWYLSYKPPASFCLKRRFSVVRQNTCPQTQKTGKGYSSIAIRHTGEGEEENCLPGEW